MSEESKVEITEGMEPFLSYYENLTVLDLAGFISHINMVRQHHMSTKHMVITKKRFTVIEALVVLTIIGILGGLLLPGLIKFSGIADRRDVVEKVPDRFVWSEVIQRDSGGGFFKTFTDTETGIEYVTYNKCNRVGMARLWEKDEL